MQKKYLFILILIISSSIIILFWFYKSYLKDDKEFCLDTGRCKEGLEINTEYGRIKINRKNCLKYGWEWNGEGKYCNLND